MPVLKQHADQTVGVRGVAFDFEDVNQRAGNYLEQVRGEAAKIVRKAQEEADAIRQQAEQEGRRAGMAAIEQIATDKLGQQMTTLLPALREAVNEIQRSRVAFLANWEQSAVHLATAIAARVVRRELKHQPEITLSLVREALELAAGSPDIRILMNPQDHEALAPQVKRLVAEMDRLGTVKTIADARISRGGCRVETHFGSIDQQFESQLARIEEELT
ncbi:MAG: hypothetical protein KF708_17975 [Pirellulales bacterium]|nr:hypothetical protein [Pirellulales bacterium]